MAVSTREIIIANPARKRASGKKKRSMARTKKKMSAKQIRFFGSKRQRAALKAKRKRPAHRAASKPNPARRRKPVAHRTHRKRTAKRRNPVPEIISLTLGNPAKRRKKAVAKTKRRKNASARRKTNAGRRTTRRNPAVRHHRRGHRRNPAGMGVTDLLALGGGAVVGGALPKVASQAILGSKNTGWMGYLSNIAGTMILSWGAHKFAKGPMGASFAKGILAGGIGQVLSRMISDYSLLGSYGTTLGLGDYMVSNFASPQWLPDALNSPMVNPPNGWTYQPPAAAVVAGTGMGMYQQLY